MEKVGILTFSPGVSQDPYFESHLEKLVNWLRSNPELDITYSDKIIGNIEIAREESKRLSVDVDCMLFFIPEWTFPSLIVTAAKAGKGPYLLFSPLDPKHAGLTGMLATAGALDQVGIKNIRIWGQMGSTTTLKKISKHIKVVSTLNKLSSRTLGLFGGETMGMYTTANDSSQIQSVFGVCIRHFDQLEIVERSKNIPKDRIKKGYEWINQNVKEINLEQDKLNKEILERQISCYHVVKEMARKEKLDFLAIKCHPELSERYCTQCLTQAFMNDPYDWEGEKEIIPTACEADVDGAITMEILHLLTGDPVLFFDIRHLSTEENLLTFTNCGAQSTWYADKHLAPDRNLGKVSLYPQIFQAGGASLQYQCSPGEITLARLSRRNGEYVMQIVTGEFVEKPIEEMKKAVFGWPQGFVKLKCDPEEVLASIGSNHMHAVYGDVAEELIELSNLLDIDSEVFS